MTFKEYLESKKIAARAFALREPDRFGEFKSLFDQVHPESFTAQKLFLINRLRRKYPLGEATAQASAEAPKPKMMKPKINISPKR